VWTVKTEVFKNDDVSLKYVTHIVTICLYRYCACYVLFTFTLLLKYVHLYTLLITVQQDDRKFTHIYCPVEIHERSCVLDQTYGD